MAMCLSAATAAPQVIHTFITAPAIPTITSITLLRSQPFLAAAPAPIHVVARPVDHAVAAPIVVEERKPLDLDASYSYSNSVTDETSGDSKIKEESMSNRVISAYSVADPNGRLH